jgi:hypothetical protein
MLLRLIRTTDDPGTVNLVVSPLPRRSTVLGTVAVAALEEAAKIYRRASEARAPAHCCPVDPG